MDPSSIAVGAASLERAWNKAVWAIMFAHDGAKLMDPKVKLLHDEIRQYLPVLEHMWLTMEVYPFQDTFRPTVRVGALWRHIALGVEDSHETLNEVLVLLKAGESDTALEGTNQQSCLDFSADEIEIYRSTIKTYRDAMEVSIQTLQLWSEVGRHESSEKTWTFRRAERLARSIRDLDIDMSAQIASFCTAGESNNTVSQFWSLRRMRGCVRAAADVVSSALTTLELGDGEAVVVPSEGL